MAINSKPPVPVTDAMKKAGAAEIATDMGSSDEEVATRVYRAMVEAITPVYGMRPAQDEVADAFDSHGGGDKRKEKHP